VQRFEALGAETTGGLDAVRLTGTARGQA